ncbi:PAS domain S-box protein [Fodinibius sp.]|uniref:PAS domain-containing sensor histidine kinase n=1 Tax=Fodinibius sp. TaxID=1872440 RepID=UPI00356A62E8
MSHLKEYYLNNSVGERDLRTMMDNLPRLVMLLDLEGTILYWNGGGEKVFGYKAGEIVGKPVWRLYSGRESDNFIDELSFLKKGEDLSLEVEGRHKDGSRIWLDVKRTIIENSRGEPVILGTASDISLQKKAEFELTKSQARTEAILEAATEGIITIDREGIIQNFNQAAEEMFGYRSGEVVGKNVSKLMPSPYQEEHDQYLENYLETGERKIIGIGRQVRGKRKDGSVFPIELAVSEVQFGDEIIFTVLIKDISSQRKLENEILKIAEGERRRIGHELHDGLGQMLSGISLISRNLARKLEANGLPAADEVLEISKMIREADEHARELAHGLAHIDLENEGLQAALSRLCERNEELTEIPCVFECPNDIEIEKLTVALHLYRIAQEAINNAVKHGQATKVFVRLEANENKKRLQLVVEDNGKGFSATEKEKHAGMGINTMKYRSHILGGKLNITETPEGWTRVICSIPSADIETLNKI